MKGFLIISALGLALTACVATPPEASSPSSSTPEPVAAAPHAVVQDAADSEWWNPSVNTYNDLWPASGAAITISSVQVMFKKGPDSSAGPTFIAFVVWNGNFIGKIFRVHVGADGSSFHSTYFELISARAYGHPDRGVSSSGNPTSGTGKPTPHPNVDGSVHYPDNLLNNVRDNAAIIRDAAHDFEHFGEATGVTLPG